MPRRRSHRLRALNALSFVLLAMGGMYAVVQFATSMAQLYAPLLSYDTQSTSTWGEVISFSQGVLPQTVSFTFTIRNDGLKDSGGVSAGVVVSGPISGSFTVLYQDGFNPILSDTHTYDSGYFELIGATTPIIPPGTSFGFSTPNQFYVNVGNLPPLSYISFTFNVRVIPYSVYYPTAATANVTAVSMLYYPIVQSTPSFKTSTALVHFQLIAYLVIFCIAVIGGAYKVDKDLPLEGW